MAMKTKQKIIIKTSILAMKSIERKTGPLFKF